MLTCLCITANVPRLVVSGGDVERISRKDMKISGFRFSIFGKSIKAIATNRCYNFGFPTNLSTQTFPVSTSDSNFWLVIVCGKLFSKIFLPHLLWQIFFQNTFATTFQRKLFQFPFQLQSFSANSSASFFGKIFFDFS